VRRDGGGVSLGEGSKRERLEATADGARREGRLSAPGLVVGAGAGKGGRRGEEVV